MPYGSNATVSHKQVPNVMTTTSTIKAKLQLSPREMHWQTLLHLLVYTAISFLHTLYSYFRVFLCDLNWLDLVLNMPEYRPFANIHRFPGFCGNGHAWQTVDTRPLSLLPRGLGMRLKSTLIEISQVLFVFPFITRGFWGVKMHLKWEDCVPWLSGPITICCVQFIPMQPI